MWGGRSHQDMTLAPNLPQAHGPPPAPEVLLAPMTGGQFTRNAPNTLPGGRLRAAFVTLLPEIMMLTPRSKVVVCQSKYVRTGPSLAHRPGSAQSPRDARLSAHRPDSSSDCGLLTGQPLCGGEPGGPGEGPCLLGHRGDSARQLGSLRMAVLPPASPPPPPF